MAAARNAYRTIPLKPPTWERLKDYKMGGASYDDVLNELMDAVPLEKVSDRILREHEHRLKTFDGINVRDLRRRLK